MKYCLVMFLFLSTSLYAADQNIECADLRITLCRSVAGTIRCGSYSVKNWPMEMKGARFLISNCIPQTEELPMLRKVNDFCDSNYMGYKQSGQSNHLQLFYSEFKGCKYVWLSAARYKQGREEYSETFTRKGCVAPGDIETSKPDNEDIDW